MSLKGLHNRDARESNRSDLIRSLKDTLAGVLPFWAVLLGIGKLVDISSDLAKGGGDKFVR